MVVVWLREGTWRSTVRAAATPVRRSASSPPTPAGSYWRLRRLRSMRPASRDLRAGRIEREVVAACEGRSHSPSQRPRQPVGQ
ncbi:MAG: hypothetical protein DLM60_05505 [Pseudonocardiales bacterium]|nr:MAG: hypothetical protein DLM60_05505 [Pseudonocardiales bacterium]